MGRAVLALAPMHNWFKRLFRKEEIFAGTWWFVGTVQ
jgi:hypothetical protein